MGVMASQTPASRLFTHSFIQTQIKESIELCVTGPSEGNSPVIGEFPAQRASYAENVSIWWRHHAWKYITQDLNYELTDRRDQRYPVIRSLYINRRNFDKSPVFTMTSHERHLVSNH